MSLMHYYPVVTFFQFFTDLGSSQINVQFQYSICHDMMRIIIHKHVFNQGVELS